MRTWKLALALIGLAASGAQSQWLEKTISLPDSFGALHNPGPMLYNPGSNTLLIAGDNGLMVLDGLSQRKLNRVSIANFHGGPACYTPEANKVYWIERNTSRVYSLDGANGRFLGSLNIAYAQDICYNPNESRAYVAHGYSTRMVSVVNCANDSVRKTLTVGGDGDAHLCVNPVENKVYCFTHGRDTVTVIDCDRDSIRKKVGVVTEPDGMIYNRTGNKVYCWSGWNESLAVIDGRTDSVVARVALPGWVGTAAFNPLSNKLYCTVDGSIIIFCGAGDTVISSIRLRSGTRLMVFDSTNNLVWYSPYETDSLVAIDGIGDTICRAFSLGHTPEELCFNPARNLLYSAGRYVAVANPESAKVVQRILVDFTPGALCYVRQQSKVYCASENDASLAVLGTLSGRVERFVAVGKAPVALGYDRSLARVVCNNRDGPSVSFLDCAVDTATSVVALPERSALMSLDTLRHKAWCGLWRHEMALAVLDMRGESLSAVLPVSYPSCLAVDETRGRVYCGSDDGGRVFVVDAASDSVLAAVPVGGSPAALCPVLGGTIVCCATAGNNAIAVIDAEANRVIDIIPVGQVPAALLYHPRRNKLYCANSYSDDVTVIDCASMTPVATIAVGRYPNLLAYDSIADRVHVACPDDDEVAVIDCRRDSLVGTVTVGDFPVSFAAVPNLRRMYVSNRDGASVSVLRDSVRSDVEEPGQPPAQTARQATIVRGVLRIENSRQNTGNRAELLDAAGRKVADLKPGPNDIRHLGAGVYFIQTTDSDLRPMLRRIIIVPH